ncbi:MAG: hypothetical protein AseanaTS_25180 [Candidatus Pelagadaptatus aseana]|uniref:hypothetical protein n=1 Tax=Candidatus Pelagadaptatus aseana TaxID=3120508 RepID=UPI0039B2DFCB
MILTASPRDDFGQSEYSSYVDKLGGLLEQEAGRSTLLWPEKQDGNMPHQCWINSAV